MKNEFNNLKKKYFVISEEELFEIIRRASAITAKMMIGSNVLSETDTYLSINDVCEMLTVNKTTLYRWNKSDYLKWYSIGGRRLYLLSEIQDILNKKRKT